MREIADQAEQEERSMRFGSLVAIGVMGATTALGTVGCTSPTDDGSAAANEQATPAPAEENVEKTSEDLSKTVSCAAVHAKGAVPAKHRALLDTIAYTEGTRGHGDDGYNVTFAYHYFSNCAHHPDRDICSGSYCSTAAGRYQFLYGTWKGLGYANFGPADQDRGGMKLVSRRGANVPTSRPLTATEFVNVMDRISYEWASLPPGRYGQPSYSMSATRHEYCKFAGC
jgi:muramidase (phage lysozyme)